MPSNRTFAFGIDKSADRLKQLVNNEYLSDVTFQVGEKGQLIYAHKNIITMASEVFYTQFNGNFAESSTSVRGPVAIEDIDPETFLALMNYIYCDELELKADNVLDIYYVAQKYLLQLLITRCETFFETAIEESNVLIVLDKNHRYNFPAVDEKCLAIVRDNPLKFLQSDAFFKLNQRTVEVIAASRTMNCYKELVQTAIDTWTVANDYDGTNIIPQVESLQCCKLQSFSAFHYSSKIDTELTLTVKEPLNLYGLGIFIGTEERLTDLDVSPLRMKVSLQGVNYIAMYENVPLKDDLYTYEVPFIRVMVDSTVRIKVTFLPRDTKLFCMEEFRPIRSLGSKNWELEVNHKHPGSSARKTTNCVAYLLYNLVDA